MIDEKSGVDLDAFRALMADFETTTPARRSEGHRMAKQLRVPYRDRATRPDHINKLLEQFRRLTRFTTYPEDIIILDDGSGKSREGGV
jgi:hypothetical protein